MTYDHHLTKACFVQSDKQKEGLQGNCPHADGTSLHDKTHQSQNLGGFAGWLRGFHYLPLELISGK